MDPRQLGGRYFSGYWRQAYTVLKIDDHGPLGETTYWLVEWDDGTLTNHCTPWDPKRDKVLEEPTALTSA